MRGRYRSFDSENYGNPFMERERGGGKGRRGKGERRVSKSRFRGCNGYSHGLNSRACRG